MKLHINKSSYFDFFSWICIIFFIASIVLITYSILCSNYSRILGLVILMAIIFISYGFHNFKDKSLKYLFIAPALLTLCGTIVIPIIYLIYISFTNVSTTNFFKNWDFVGFKHYINLLFNDKLTLLAISKTIQFVFISVLVEFIFGFIIALTLDREFKGRGIITTILISGLMIAPIVSGLIWKYMFSLDLGFINQFLRIFNIQPQPWLTNNPLPLISKVPLVGEFLVKHLNANYGFLCVIFVDVWYMTPFVFIVLLAGLRSLPKEPFEAAAIDGANTFQIFRYITLPLLRPVIIVILLLRWIGAMKSFEGIWALFGSSVVTRTMNIHIYSLGAVQNYYSKAAALSVILLIISVIFTLFYLKFIPKQSMSKG